MRRIESEEDWRNGVVTLEFPNGQRLRVPETGYREYGAAEIARRSGYGHLLLTERLPVRQFGHVIGSMDPDFDPGNIKPAGLASIFYDPRPGDFRLVKGEWIAADSLGPGDLEAVPGFRWHRDSGSHPEGENGEAG